MGTSLSAWVSVRSKPTVMGECVGCTFDHELIWRSQSTSSSEDGLFTVSVFGFP